ncbi:MAG: O-antigen ligase family protein [Candidatus Krumholzibacteriia bacterium]
MRSSRPADCLWAAALVTLPLVGVGTSRALGGPEFATGLQPAYLLVTAAWAVRVGELGSARLRRDWRRRLADRANRPLLVTVAGTLAVVLISALGLRLAPAPVVGQEAWPRYLKQVVQLLLMLGFLVHAGLWTRGPARWRATLGWLALGLGGQLVYAPLQAWYTAGGITWLGPVERAATSNPGILSGSSWLYLGTVTAIPRLRGTMCEPLYLGSLLVVMVPLASLGRRRWLTAAALVMLVGTWSRAAWLAMLAGAAVWAVARRRAGLPGPGRRVVIAAVVALVVAAGAGWAVFGADALQLPWRRFSQILDPADWSNLTRFYSLQAAWRTALLSPVVGVGWGQFAYHFYDVVDLGGLQSQFSWPVVNSLPLLVLSETGLVGFLALFAGLTWLGRRTWKQLVVGTLARRRRLAAVAAAMAAMAVQLAMFSQYNLPHLWVVAGLWLAALAERPQPGSGRRVTP